MGDIRDISPTQLSFFFPVKSERIDKIVFNQVTYLSFKQPEREAQTGEREARETTETTGKQRKRDARAVSCQPLSGQRG